jgi:hypothetical protein
MAFDAYTEAKRGTTFDGRPIPAWSELGDEVRSAWSAAAQSVRVIEVRQGAGLTDRETKEIEFALLYAQRFNHGTDGHNAKLIIAKLYRMLTEGVVPLYVTPRP